MADTSPDGAPSKTQRAAASPPTCDLDGVMSWASTPAIRLTMQGNRGRDTEPELAVRRLLHAAGHRYRVNYRPPFMKRRTIDIAFTRIKLACFIDGCFWHGCPDHYVGPRTNESYWSDKIDGNRLRDAHTNEMLRTIGWTVTRFWEHEPPVGVAERIIDQLQRMSDLGPIGSTMPLEP